MCHVGWGGADCSGNVNSCGDNNCFGHGFCLNGTCTCDIGYTGTRCEKVLGICPNNCTGHGSCRGGTCLCHASWEGHDCATERYRCPVELGNCSGKGLCSQSTFSSYLPSRPEASPLSEKSWSCICDIGYCGLTCSKVCSSCLNNCSGHGECIETVCHCNPGFTGDDCGIVNFAYDCPNNCSSAGRCVYDKERGRARCECSEGFDGEGCDVSRFECSGNCSGHGLCGANGCVCEDGYKGKGCDVVVGTCEAMNECSGGGICVNGVCRCYPGYKGFDCSYFCKRGFNGSISCHHDLGHGLCLNGSCICKPEFSGESCEIYVVEGVEDYVSGWNPIGAAVLGIGGIIITSGAAGMLYKRFGGQKKKGLFSVPAYADVRSKVS